MPVIKNCSMTDPMTPLQSAAIALFLAGDGTFDLETARMLIKQAGGRLTWSEAGETWARLALAEPESWYPPL
jgi:hypothetical protein